MLKYVFIFSACVVPLHSIAYHMEDESVIEGLEISDNRLYIKRAMVPISEIQFREDIKASGDIFKVTLSDGGILTGTVERKESYILIGNNPVFKDTKKVMKADIVEMKELKRLQIKTYLGYILIGVIEQENSEAILLTNIYNPEGYVLTAGVRKKYENFSYTLEKYSEIVKGHEYRRPWKQFSYFGLLTYTYTLDDKVRDYLPFVYGITIGAMRGMDEWLKQKQRHVYIPLIGVFMTAQYTSTTTAAFLHVNLNAGLYWRYKLPRGIHLYLGTAPGFSYLRIKDSISTNSIAYSQSVSFIADIKVYRQFSFVIRASQDILFESGRTYLYPYFSIGGKYEI